MHLPFLLRHNSQPSTCLPLLADFGIAGSYRRGGSDRMTGVSVPSFGGRVREGLLGDLAEGLGSLGDRAEGLGPGGSRGVLASREEAVSIRLLDLDGVDGISLWLRFASLWLRFAGGSDTTLATPEPPRMSAGKTSPVSNGLNLPLSDLRLGDDTADSSVNMFEAFKWTFRPRGTTLSCTGRLQHLSEHLNIDVCRPSEHCFALLVVFCQTSFARDITIAEGYTSCDIVVA
mmetsp:Transcript_34424/g.62072  ORF Transcript_34424/g.62072 Transcript_34424/m.62072 type:complete len:231 (+) Transcript_34424:268-960(+)